MTATRPRLTPFGSALAGALGAVFANAAVYPLDTVKTRIQALPANERAAEVTEKGEPSSQGQGAKQRSSSANPVALVRALLRRLKRWEMLSMLVKIIRTEGLAGAFKGFSASMINTFSMQFAYFFFHSLLRGMAIAYRSKLGLTKSLSTSAELALGAGAGGLAQIFTIPVAVIATRQQLWTPEAGSVAKEPSLIETGVEIVKEGGITALWTGLKPGLVLTVNPAITYGVFERLKTWRLSKNGGVGKLGVAEAFWIGVTSKALATVVTYPYIFAKVRLQARPRPGSAEAIESAAKPRATGAVELLKEVYREKGLAGWYQGLGAQIFKAVLCQGILFVSKDQFEDYAWIIMNEVNKLAGKVAPAATA